MVHLKKLEMKGFKSFGSRRLAIDLDKGLTVITGPNGSGKSNILDAIRFVLGDLSSRALRADRMAGVIFDGGKTKSSTASVTLHLDNSNRRIPVDTNTVTITRKVDKSGESEYVLNGRQIPRGQLVDILRMAGLSSSGHNIIMQGTITRLSDITPEERRKVIEDLIGIAEYDAKKSEARNQLQQADLNIRVASTRIGDVQARIERLEEERNDALRYDFIQKEMKKLQAALLSHRLLSLQAEETNIVEKLREKSAEAELFRKESEQLISERKIVETERRKFDEEVVDKGNVRLFSFQKTIGDLMASVAGLEMEINSGKNNLTGLKKLHKDRLNQLVNLEQKINELNQAILDQKSERDKLKGILDEKNNNYLSISSKQVEVKKNLEERNMKLVKIEDALEDIRRKTIELNAQMQGHDTRQDILYDEIKTLKERRDSFELTLKDLQQHFTELQKLQKIELNLEEVTKSINTNISKEETLNVELDEAEKTVKTASATLIEVEAQKSLAEKIASDESSLQKIEEMGRVGAIPGIFGRLETLLKVDLKFQKAIEAASSGWFKSIVVKDTETALRCVESLKRMQLGRVRLIPLKEIKNFSVVEVPDIEGVIGSASSLIRCEEKYINAINFIFGDTIVTSGEKSAFLVSRAGYRAVDLNGDLYEAGGGIVGGYYREPIDFASLIPSEKAIYSLYQNVKSLDELLKKRKIEISSIDDAVTRLREERIRRSEIIKAIEREIKIISLNVTRARQNLATLDTRYKKLSGEYEKGRTIQSELLSKSNFYEKNLSDLASKRENLITQEKTEALESYNERQIQLNLEINDLDKQLTKIESNSNLLESNLKNVLIPEFKAVKTDVTNIEKQISSIQDRVMKAQASLNEANTQISKIEKSREELSTSLSSIKDRRREFEEHVDRIEMRLRNLDREWSPLNNEVRELEFGIQRNELNIKRIEEELSSLGYEGRMHTEVDEVKNAEATIRLMKLELEQLGSVNQLAISQYEEQKDNYKQLSIRQNELEKERRAILMFMEEIERKKTEDFMSAFRRISKDFATMFQKLTGGGEAYLNLEKIEEPFAGGIDIFAKFPEKAFRLIAGASGGEKSVTAVAFIFAIQSYSPAPFYIFDEIDAHLDPYNAERLADLLKEQSTNSQLINLTLRDVIMDRADRLFGVYIQNGISRIVSIMIAEAAA